MKEPEENIVYAKKKLRSTVLEIDEVSRFDSNICSGHGLVHHRAAGLRGRGEARQDPVHRGN